MSSHSQHPDQSKTLTKTCDSLVVKIHPCANYSCGCQAIKPTATCVNSISSTQWCVAANHASAIRHTRPAIAWRAWKTGFLGWSRACRAACTGAAAKCAGASCFRPTRSGRTPRSVERPPETSVAACKSVAGSLIVIRTNWRFDVTEHITAHVGGSTCADATRAVERKSKKDSKFSQGLKASPYRSNVSTFFHELVNLALNF